MPPAPKPRELDLTRIRRWVNGRVPVEHQDQVRVEIGVRGANVTIFEMRGTCGRVRPVTRVAVVKYTITPLGGAGRPIGAIAAGVVDYLLPGRSQRSPTERTEPGEGASHDGAVRYYADSGDGGRWSGRGAARLGLSGDVRAGDFAKVLAGRHPATGERLISAQGSAGRRRGLGVGTATRRDADGNAVYDARDAAAVLGLTEAQAGRMIKVGTVLAITRAFGLPVRGQPPGSYLVPRVGPKGERWVSEAELSRCHDALASGTTADDIAATGPPSELIAVDEAARLVGVTPRYLRRLAKRYETDSVAIDAAVANGRPARRAYLVATRGARDRWVVSRSELAAFVERRRPPAVRVGYDLTLTTEKSLGVLALLSDGRTRHTVLDAITAGNDRAMAWLERHAAATRVRGEVVPVNGWTAASFVHHTSRALDPFPHVHNVLTNTVEDHEGERRALDARGLYQHARAASALATAEMRHQLTSRLGVRWRRAAHGGWEIAGIPDVVLREFSQRSNEIDDALRELEEAIGRGARPDELDHIKTATRPNKTHVPLDRLLSSWWERATAHGFDRSRLASCVTRPTAPPEPEVEDVHAALAAADGICQSVSIFDRGDVLAHLVKLNLAGSDNAEPQPLIVGADRLEQIADGFLDSPHVVRLTERDGSPNLYTTREMLEVQDRIVARYRKGRHRSAAVVPSAILDESLARHPMLTGEQLTLVRSFCTSGHRTQLAVGHPGAGKTTAMAAARDAWQAAGYRLIGAAVKGEAARTLGTTAGIRSETLAWYLAHDDPLPSPLDARTILVVDEASTISDRDLDRLGWLASQTGATLRLIGDPAQHGAVEAGGMFRVLCERHPNDVPQLTHTHRLLDEHDRAAADHLRDGDVAAALDALDAAGHLHVIDDDIRAYSDPFTRWWEAHRAGQSHPMVSRRNDVRRALNRLAHELRRAAGEIDGAEIPAVDGRRFGVGDRVIARVPNRHLHPDGEPSSYVRNGALGTIVDLGRGDSPEDDTMTVRFDDIGVVTIPRDYFDEHEVDRRGRRDVGIDHAYAVTSYAVTGATHAVSTSRIDETSTRAETYVDITRGREANHLYLTRPRNDIEGERLPRTPPDPVEDAITRRLTTSEGERTAWEIREDRRKQFARNRGVAVGL